MIYLSMFDNNINEYNKLKVGNMPNFRGVKNKNSMTNQQDLPLYYKYTNNPYQPSELEENFRNEIIQYASDTNSSKANFAESFLMFDSEINDDISAKIYMFTSLIEALDKTQIPTQKALLFETLDSVIAEYKNDLSSIINFYLSSDILKQNTKDYLKGTIK